MQRRTKIIITVIILALLALAAWFWLSRKGSPALATIVQQVQNVGKPKGSLNVNSGYSANVNAAQPAPEPAAPPAPQDSSAALKRLASSVAERYGSYSTIGDFENQTDLLPIMSDAFAARTNAAVAALRAKPQPAAFFGVTSRAINATVDALDEKAGTAVVTVNVQRRETDAAGTETVKYQNVRLTFTKENDAWKLDSVKWQ